MDTIIIEQIRQMEKDENKDWEKIPAFSTFLSERTENYRKNTVGTLDELQKGLKVLKDDALKEYRLIKESLREIHAERWKSIQNQIFEDSLCHEYGEELFKKMWKMAYDKGHSNGMVEVYNEFDELDDYTYDVIQLVKSK